MSLYAHLGVKTYINAMDTVSAYGGARMSVGVLDAMESASQSFVEIAELQVKVGERIAKMTGNEAAYVSSGARAGLMLCVAVCMTQGEEQLLQRLPHAKGLRNEVVLLSSQRTAYDREMELVGARTVEVGDSLDSVRAALTERTAALCYADLGQREGVSFEEMLAVAQAHGLPLLVNAAAQLPPAENLWRFTQAGAAAAVFSGGRALGGPSGSGLVVGRRDLVEKLRLVGAPRHGIGNSAGIGREEIVGLYAALKDYLRPGLVEEKIAKVENAILSLRRRVEKAGYFAWGRSYPGPTGQAYPRLRLEILGPYSSEALVEMLRQGQPGILVSPTRRPECANGITINLMLLDEGEIDMVLDRVEACAQELTKVMVRLIP